jgi:photosystem II stability/assembly factor-like uncharacterized protein
MVVALTAFGNTLLASAWTDSGAIYRSTNGGTSWTQGLAGRLIRGFAYDGVMTYAVGTSSSILNSTDGGIHWGVVSDGTPIGMAWAVNDSFFFATGINGVVRSPDKGKTWEPTGLVNDFIISMIATDSVLVAGSDFGGVRTSTDNGLHWTKGNTDSLFNSSLALDGNVVYDGTDRGVYRSTDGGLHWVSIGLAGNQPFDGIVAVGGFAKSRNHLFALTNSGARLWTLPLSILSIRSVSSIPPEWQLQQNYPNPFNPSTTIRYGVPMRSHVTLTVYNTLGQQVATLVQGEEEAGYHDVRFDGAGMASGVYFYRIQAGTYAETRKFLLVR